MRPTAERGNTVQITLADRVHRPPTCGIQGHRPEHADLIGQRRDVADALATIGQHHREIDVNGHETGTRVIAELAVRATMRLALASRCAGWSVAGCPGGAPGDRW